MNKIISSLLIFLLFSCFLFGCTNNTDELYESYLNESVEPVSGTSVEEDRESAELELSGSLVLYSYDAENSYLQDVFIESFQEKYPHVEIELTGPSNENGEDFVLEATVALMSGNAADVVSLSMLPYQNYAKSGLFENLYEYMEADSDLVV